MKPIIAIPMGDPAGIGPEIIVKAVASSEIQLTVQPLVIADARIIQQALEITGISLRVHCIQDLNQYSSEKNILNLIDLQNVKINDFQYGAISAMCGNAAFEAIKKSIELALSKQVAAIATPPINKESLKAASIPFIGHTEIFAELTNTKDPLTMFEVRGMRVFFLSRHVSLRQACDLVTKERIIDYVKRCKKVLEQLGVKDGTMAVAGLNPHSGEHGLFGNEEVNEIEPAVQALQNEEIDVVGPISADSVFYLALQGRYNSVLSLYHDQGHIATKTFDFERTIAITGGLPILRTSVDHGTAFDIAGKNIASEVSMIEAILLAGKYAHYFH